MKPTQEELKDYLIYDHKTGVFTRKNDSKRYKAGDKIGTIVNTGATRISIKDKSYLDGQLAILYMEGYLPKYVVRKDNVHSNNAYKNLVASDLRSVCNNWRVNSDESRKFDVNDSAKQKIMAVLDGHPMNQTGIVDEVDLDSSKVKLALNELIGGVYIKTKRNRLFTVTPKGHAELLRKGQFEVSERLSKQFQLVLTGKLTANADGKKAYLY